MKRWPEPVERVSAVLRAAAVDARIEEFGDACPYDRYTLGFKDVDRLQVIIRDI